MSKRQDISSDDYTLFHKVIFPILTSLFAAIGVVIGLINIRSDLWFFIIFWPAMAAWILRSAMRLKWVSVDEAFVYVSCLKKEIRIPLSNIDKIESSEWARPKEITLWLKSPSEFGQKIVFVPRQRFFEGVRSGHPIVDELRARVKSEKPPRT